MSCCSGQWDSHGCRIGFFLPDDQLIHPRTFPWHQYTSLVQVRAALDKWEDQVAIVVDDSTVIHLQSTLQTKLQEASPAFSPRPVFRRRFVISLAHFGADSGASQAEISLRSMPKTTT